MQKKVKTAVTILIILGAFMLLSFSAYAADANTAYLYFYTVDGDEIEKLKRTISSKKEYTFKDPDLYKYLSYEDSEGNAVTNELNDQVKGLYWEEEIDFKGTGKKYKFNDTAKFNPGEHYFRVKTDSPALTGENTMYLSPSEKVHLSFYTVDYEEEVETLAMELSPDDEYTFPDPSKYATLEGESAYTGLFWRCEDDNGKIYLFRIGEKAKFRAGYYSFRVVTDEPVTIRYRYPVDCGELLCDAEPGDLYATVTATVGDTIRLKKSLGAVIWGSDFAGWEETNYDFGTYDGGSSYNITDNEDLAFFAIYEENEDWDPFAVDENLGEDDITSEDKDYYVSSAQVNAVAGTGYGAYIDGSGKLRRKTGGKEINSETRVKGVPGTINKAEDLTSLEKGGDKKDPSAYTKDKYGNPINESKIANNINGVLKQDDSALYMDAYGNSMIYHSDLGRIEDLCIAYLRLENKNDSFASMVSDWDTAAIDRFEAIGFSLLSDKYPGRSDSAYQQFNENSSTVLKIKGVGGLTAEDKLPEWKNEYLSEKAWKILASYKQIWTGWLDNYTDGLEELYKGTKNGTTVVGSIMDTIKDTITVCATEIKNGFCMTAYAADFNNTGGIGNQYGARLNYTMDVKETLFAPQYFDPDRLYSFGAYGFSTLDGLTAEQQSALQVIFDYLVNTMGFSEEMAAGVCGNLWQESGFNPKLSGSTVGIVQWAGSRKTSLISFASSKSTDWTDLNIQLQFMQNELNGNGYLGGINAYLKRYGSSSVSTVKDPLLACDAWCAEFEGCVCKNGNTGNGGYHGTHSDKCAVASNGKSYQELALRRSYTTAVYNAMVRYGGLGDGGYYAGMSNSEILMSLFGYGSKNEVQAHYTLSELKSMCVGAKLSDGRSITVHKAVAQDVADALNALIASGFEVDNTTYGWRSGANTSGGGYSFHNLGLAIDINCGTDSKKTMGWAHNPQFYIKDWTHEQIKENYSPRTDPLAIGAKEAAILSNYGLKWGRDFTSRPDIMHFSIGEVGTSGKNDWISNLVEGAGR